MGDRIAVVEDVWGEALSGLARTHEVRRPPDAWIDPDMLRDAVSEAAAVVVRNRAQVTEELLAAAPDLKIVARAGVGLDNIDIAAADRAGVVVSAALGANAVSVAEHTLLLALGVLREVVAHNRAVRAGAWDRRAGVELSGKTWGLLGLGATGLAVAKLLRGFGMRIIGHDPYLDPKDPRLGPVEAVGLDEVLAGADVLSVHLPATTETRNLVDAGLLGRMKPDAVLVNVGRGEVVDEAGLAAALRSGHLAGAGLDVRPTEPPGPSPLDGVESVIYTPHIAGITGESQERIVSRLVDDIRAVLSGTEARSSVGKLASVQRRAA
ncbi:NAD(P)-dependent oxidoreductase [Saccharopolyspora shandongensis]|uniref:NAD(P)-dependent oxidoreductase n=1 Tax=Saccharopolyspora shandongensis TaxID=418495 RepID=UPI00340F1D65